jgi:hypothetical protein
LLSAVLNPSWTVVFGISLSIALFAIKFAVARTPRFDDLVVGLADIPTVLTASACSLLVATISQADDWRIPGSRVVWLVFIFLFNVFVFRYVESRKRSLSSGKMKVAGLIGLSMAASVVFSFNLVSSSYLDIGQ